MLSPRVCFPRRRSNPTIPEYRVIEMERAYTVQEIDALRQVVRREYLFGSYAGPLGSGGRSYNEVDMEAVVEERVRTWMLAAKTAQDLRDSKIH